MKNWSTHGVVARERHGLAFGATHAPHHVPLEWADKYRDAGLVVEGLMTVPAAAGDPRPTFAALRDLAPPLRPEPATTSIWAAKEGSSSAWDSTSPMAATARCPARSPCGSATEIGYAEELEFFKTIDAARFEQLLA